MNFGDGMTLFYHLREKGETVFILIALVLFLDQVKIDLLSFQMGMESF